MVFKIRGWSILSLFV